MQSAMNLQNNEGKVVNQDWESKSLDMQDVIAESSAQDGAYVHFGRKRLRKPTLRYIEESSSLNSRYHKKRQKLSISPSAVQFSGVKHDKHLQTGSGLSMLSSDETFSKAIQVPFGFEGQKECRKKHPSTVVQTTQVDSSPDWSNYDSTKTVQNTDIKVSLNWSKHDSRRTVVSEEDGNQRKHHKLWSLSEVRTLIDGVSRYGVGNWSQIKRFLFSSSDHRTAVDLKDKWRNLLKASCAEEQRKKEDEKRRNQPWRPLPKSLLQRVSELASSYSYPKDEKVSRVQLS